MKQVVCVKTNKYEYPKEDLFRPFAHYPEYPFKEFSESENHVYDLVRCGLRLMGYDKDNYDTTSWNPLGEIIKPGDQVLIKPNLVMHENHISDNGTECLYTQPSLVAAITDYVIIALEGKGSIVIGDAPMQECDFEELISSSGYDDLVRYYQSKFRNTMLEIRLADFRGLKSKNINGVRHSAEVDVKGIVVDLKNNSEFFRGGGEYFYDNMRITNYDPAYLKQHHNADKHEYFINSDVLNADVVINMPKPKTHRKAGVTISMKNLVGINCRKEYLPHHTNGSKEEGGDEYLHRSYLKKWMDILNDKRNYLAQTKKAYKRAWILNKVQRIIWEIIQHGKGDPFYEGSWYGNDTISRTIVDLNKILFYADKNGIMQKKKQRKFLIVADMIISGEKEGPVAPSPKEAGVIAMGDDPVCFDEVILGLMGAKAEYISTVKHGRNVRGDFRLTEEEAEAFIVSNYEKWNGKRISEIDKKELLFFIPTEGWKKAFYTMGNADNR